MILAHGAGAPMDSDFMAEAAQALGASGHRVLRFEFPYMAARRGPEGRKRPPDRAPILLARWQAVLDAAETLSGVRPEVANRPVIGGKSMGGRIAALIAEQQPDRLSGLICLGFPLHAVGKPKTDRGATLEALSLPTLICQGERDSMGTASLLQSLALPAGMQLHILPDGDHSFKPRKASGRTEAQNRAEAWSAIADFLQGLPRL